MKVLSLAPLAGPAVDRLRALGELEVDPWNSHVPVQIHSPADLLARLAGVSVLLVEADHISAEIIDAADSLRILGVCRGDPVNVDLAAATKAALPVLNAPGRNADAVAELAVGLIIASLRGIVAADDDARAGRWVIDGRIPQQRYLGRELRSMTVGLIGCGAVGRAAAWRLRALGARVLGFDPHADPERMREAGIEPNTLEDVLGASDVVSIHALLTDETRGMIGAAEIAHMRDGTFLINTARAAIVEEEPLVEALRSGRIAAAAFDHFQNEFLPEGHPFLSMPNVILTPHLGGTTVETIEAHTAVMADGVEALLAGREPPNVVNPETLPAFFASRA